MQPRTSNLIFIILAAAASRDLIFTERSSPSCIREPCSRAALSERRSSLFLGFQVRVWWYVGEWCYRQDNVMLIIRYLRSDRILSFLKGRTLRRSPKGRPRKVRALTAAGRSPEALADDYGWTPMFTCLAREAVSFAAVRAADRQNFGKMLLVFGCIGADLCK